MTVLNVVTFNLLNKPSRWHQRRHLIAAELAELQPDLIALQEVALPENNAQWLADQLGDYSVYMASKTGNQAGKEGIAILSRIPIENADVHTLDLRTQNRIAQFVRIWLDGQPIMFVNGHFYFHVVDHVERMRQVESLLGWIDATSSGAPAIVCGDFNSTPESRSISLMRERFHSAYMLRHGHEPDYTCPTPLRYSFSPVRHALLCLGNFILNQSFEPWRGTIDYIFVQSHVTVVECKRILHRPAPHDATLYPSDHVGLAATLAIP